MPEYITIRTARNVEIEYALAGIGDRVIAKIIDTLILIGYIFMTGILSGMAGSWIVGGLMAVPAFFFTFIFERFNNGQTPGKSIMQIRVVALNGENVTTGMYFIRWLLQLIDIRLVTGVVGLISILVTEDAQRLGDIAAGTTVVSNKKKSNLAKSAYRKINKNYQPIFAGAEMLNDEDVQTIQQVLKTQADNKHSLITMTAAKVEEIYDLKKSGSATTFLRNIVNDYNYYQYHAHMESFNKYEDDHKQGDLI